jgi:predicted outer membrane repeat protein
MSRLCSRSGLSRVFPPAIGVAMLIGFSVGAVAPSTPVTILFVDADATGGANSGASWADAYTDFQDALTRAVAGGYEIWVAEGTYRPSVPSGRDATFQLLNHVALYGGFDGTEDERADRDWRLHETILSGDIGAENDASDNSFGVVTGSGTDDTAILDGFTVTDGNANGDTLSSFSGGGMTNMSGSPTVIDCIFFDNFAKTYGGGMYNYESNPTVIGCTFLGNSARLLGGGMSAFNSSPTVTDCTFINNEADYGGGIHNWRSSATVDTCTFSGNLANFDGGGMFNGGIGSPTVTRCTFSGNRAASGSGGGIYNTNASPTVTDCTFSDNSAEVSGGGMRNYANILTVANCTFSANTATSGGGMGNTWSNPTVTHCTFSGNVAVAEGGGMYNDKSYPTVKNTILASNTPDDCNGRIASGGYNLDCDGSCFTDGVNNDISDRGPHLGRLADNGGPTETHALLPCSLAIDAIPPPYNGAPPTDQRGEPRPYPAGGLADIGAVERNEPIHANGDVNSDGAIDLLDVVLCQQISWGLNVATACGRLMADVDEDGDVDADDVTILSEYVLGIRTTLP